MELTNYDHINSLALNHDAQLVVVTKNQSIEDILTVFNAGHGVFGENKVQDLIYKRNELPADIEWHMIGSLQKNKVKLIAPWIDMIHSVDSFSLAKLIDQEAELNNRTIPILLEVKITDEADKHGFIENDLITSLYRDNWDVLHHLKISGLMGMASFTNDTAQIRTEFRKLKSIFMMLQSNYFKNSEFKELSMGMSGDYEIALEEGSTLIRVGSKIFEN